MNYTKEELITYRVNRAEESLEEAILLAENKYWNTVINRLYYACYYIVSALLIKHDVEAKTHAGTKTLFNQHFLKNGLINDEYGKFYAALFNQRQESDYADLKKFQRSDVIPYLSKSPEFISLIKNHISA